MIASGQSRKLAILQLNGGEGSRRWRVPGLKTGTGRDRSSPRLSICQGVLLMKTLEASAATDVVSLNEAAERLVKGGLPALDEWKCARATLAFSCHISATLTQLLHSHISQAFSPHGMATESTGLVSGAKAEQPLGKLATMALISGANSGYTIHIVSFVLVRLRREIEGISDLTYGIIGSAVYAGLLVGCPLGGTICSRWGRRLATLVGELTILLACIIGGLIAPLVMHMPSMFVACLVAWRLVVGIGTGICVTVKPVQESASLHRCLVT